MTRFNIKDINIEVIERLDSISAYNHNYYKIKSSSGDYYEFYDNDVMYVESRDDCVYETVYIGKLAEGNFIPAFVLTSYSEW